MGFRETNRTECTSDIEESVRQMLGMLFGRDVEEEEIERFSEISEEPDIRELSVKEKIDVIFNNELDMLVSGGTFLENVKELEALLQCYHMWTQLEK